MRHAPEQDAKEWLLTPGRFRWLPSHEHSAGIHILKTVEEGNHRSLHDRNQDPAPQPPSLLTTTHLQMPHAL